MFEEIKLLLTSPSGAFKKIISMSNQHEQRDINVGRGNYLEKFKNYFERIKSYFTIKANTVNIVVNDNDLDNIPESTGLPHNIPKSSTDKFVGRE